METANEHNPLATPQRLSEDIAKLIRKLRWLGLEDEARSLQMAASTLPPDERGTVSLGPFSTD